MGILFLLSYYKKTAEKFILLRSSIFECYLVADVSVDIPNSLCN